jgi:hypothetical protein
MDALKDNSPLAGIGHPDGLVGFLVMIVLIQAFEKLDCGETPKHTTTLDL